MKLKIALLQMHAAEALAAPNKNIEEIIRENTEIADKYCFEAAACGADIALFPEMFSIGYPTPYNENNFFESWFNVAFENQKPDPDNILNKLRSYAIDDHHEYIKHFRQLAKKLNMAIAITYMSQGKKYPRNTMLLVDRFGNDIIKYSKTHLFAPFFIDAICEPGGKFFVKELDTKVGLVKVGLLICADRNLPEPSRVLMMKGAELVLIANACSLKGLGGILLDAVKIRAFENAMAIAICNYPEPKNDGYSALFAPNGNMIFRAESEEGVFIATYDLEELRNYRKTTAEGNAFRAVNFYKEGLSGEVKAPFAGRLNALGVRPSYYEILVDTLLGYFVAPYAKKKKRDIIAATPKFYLFDVGLAGALTQRVISVLKGSDAGRAFEHFILMELIAYRGINDLDFPITFWRTKTGLEVDFVLSRDIAVEVKIGNAINKTELRGLQAFCEEHHPKKAYVVSLDIAKRKIQFGKTAVLILPYAEFLNLLWNGEII